MTVWLFWKESLKVMIKCSSVTFPPSYLVFNHVSTTLFNLYFIHGVLFAETCQLVMFLNVTIHFRMFRELSNVTFLECL